MAGTPSQLSEDLPPNSSRGRGAQPQVAAEARCAASGAVSCKEQLSSGPKALHRRSLAGRPGGGGSCKEQLGFLSDVHFSATCARCGRSARILKTTTCWSGCPNPLIKIPDAHPGSDQRTASPPLGGKVVLAQDRAASAHRPPQAGEVSQHAGIGTGPPRTRPQNRPLESGHCRTA